MKQLTIFDLPHNIELEHKEMLLYLVRQGKLAKDKDGYYWTDVKVPLGERPDVVLNLCPECKTRHHDITKNCNQVWGRRGWRTLGDYDG